MDAGLLAASVCADEDTHGAPRMRRLIRAQSLLRRTRSGTAMVGSPRLSVPTRLPAALAHRGVTAQRSFREDLVLRAGEVIEAAASFSALANLPPQAEAGD